jgi:hypothetical protein
MKKIKHIQTIRFDLKVHSISGWIYSFLIPGKDHIDICYDEEADLFLYAYRGQGTYSVSTIRLPKPQAGHHLEEGDIEFLSVLEEKHLFGDSLLCTILDKNRNTVISIIRGAYSGGISVSENKK